MGDVPAEHAAGSVRPMTLTDNATCTCGHLVTTHHLTDGGRRTYCCAGDQSGNCPCQRYERADRAGVAVCT